MGRAAWTLLLLVPLLAEAQGASDGGVKLPSAPFQAWVKVQSAYVRLEPSLNAPEVGLVMRDDALEVTGCVPSCDAPSGWALLGEDGAIRLSNLTLTPPARATPPPGVEMPYVYGTVKKAGAAVRVEPRPNARVVEREQPPHVLAFHNEPELLDGGWLERPAGGYVSTSDVRIDRPSSLEGEHFPSLPLAFLIRDTQQVAASDAGVPDAGEPFTAHKYERFPVQGLDKAGRVLVPGGTLPRGNVRLVLPRERPAGVKPGERWVHVELSEQVLTAYEGDTPVLATLVSTGKPSTPTREGRFRVWYKVVHDTMHGPESNPYVVEEVPHTLFFHRGQALHGAFWHDSFGRAVTHGCVNLSVKDATWLFAWAPPALPQGFHAYWPEPARRPSLWVLVERRPVSRIDPDACKTCAPRSSPAQVLPPR
ncbi:L,D-transpeptidase [Archangium violaceum]|uniref:L,D-transpeptidase n=1 Tax=Archangium violaceum TaxID=83451 RepID=UPI0037BE6EAF